MTETPQPQDNQSVDGPHVRFEDALLDKLTGKWLLTRMIGNRFEENSVKGEWVLNHQFFQIHMQDVKSPPEYEALIMIGYNHELNHYVVHWLDTFGGKFSEKGIGTRKGNSIQFVFQYPDSLLHNTFTWSADGPTWRSLIEQQDEQGQWSIFAEDTLQRR